MEARPPRENVWNVRKEERARQEQSEGGSGMMGKSPSMEKQQSQPGFGNEEKPPAKKSRDER